MVDQIINGVASAMPILDSLSDLFDWTGDRAYNRAQNEKAWDWREKEWNRQEYWNQITANRDEERYRNTIQREDNAVQRRVEDLKKAGLSPILATGQGAMSGMQSPPSIRGGQGSTSGHALDVRKLDTTGKSALAMQMMRQNADISLTSAQKELIEAQKQSALAQKELTDTQKDKEEHNLNIYKEWGVPTDSPAPVKSLVSGAEGVGNLFQKAKQFSDDAEKQLKNATEAEKKKFYEWWKNQLTPGTNWRPLGGN